jgi:hypothetical protein
LRVERKMSPTESQLDLEDIRQSLVRRIEPVPVV